MTTKGQYRVGVSFNPSADPVVDIIKTLTAKLIDAVDAIPEHDSEGARLKALAMTHYEDAAMWAVKAQTKQPAPATALWKGPPPTPTQHATDPFVEAVRSGVMAVMGSLGPWDPPKVLGSSEFMHVLSHLQKRGFNGATQADIELVLRDLRREGGK